MIIKLFNKLFLSSYFFTIAIRKKQLNSEKRSMFVSEFLLPARRKCWVADPILVDHQGETYLFYESLVGEKGRIEVVRVHEDCSVSKPRIILEDDCHYSYPFVFSKENQWYMIPESSACNQVRLYRAVEFPYKWEQMGVLLHQRSVDTTVFCFDGEWYLQTYLLHPDSERVDPQIYRMDWNGEVLPELTQLEWSEYDSLMCRGAGPLFLENGVLIRPAQENGEDQYGNAVRFYGIEQIGNEYREKLLGRLTPDRINAKVWLDGLHTYTVSERFEAIDIRTRKFDLFKTPRTLAKKCLRKLKR